ncbi:MAG: hypothetical protein FJ122_00560 [Deltaproteobacteria bacterium]|nr:hypothetical protein [Deltaproteobacteria bacterium]
MGRRGLILVLFALFAFTSGCDMIKDATDIEFTIIRSHVFTIDANLTTFPYDVDLTTDSDYQRYKGKIRDIDIDYLRYSITSNTGSGGKSDFYANSFGGSFATATKVAETISFAAGETRGATDVVWLNKNYMENLLITGKLSVWAVAEGTNVRLTIPVEIKVKVTANPFE